MKKPITTERADLFDVNMLVGMEISVKGFISERQIRTAFDKAVLCHEILCTKIQIESDGSAYYVPQPSSGTHKNSVIFTDSTLEEIFKTQEKIRFRIEDGEYLKLFVRLQEGRFSALFLMHHLAGDGKSLLYFIETFMRTLNGEDCDFLPIRLLTLDELPKESELPKIAKMFIQHYNKVWQKDKQLKSTSEKSPRIFSFSDMQQSYENFWSNHETEITVKTYDCGQIRQMKSESKSIGCHLTAYMLTKYLENERTVRDIGLAVDGRLDGNRSMGNQATGISVKTKYNPKKSFAENALRIQKMLDEKLNRPMNKYFILRFMAEFSPTLVDAVNLCFSGEFKNKLAKKLARLLGYGENTKDLSVTNLAVIDIPSSYGDYEIERVVFVPPVVSYGKNIVGIITHKDEMTVCVHKYKN